MKVSTLSRSIINVLRRAVWYMSAERISWWVLFPLQLWFALNHRWLWVGVCAVASTFVLVFRRTIANIRVLARIRAHASEQHALDTDAELYLRSLRAGKPSKREPLVLFLRSFSADREIHGKDPSAPDGYDKATLETRLAIGFARQFTTIALSSRLKGRDIWGDAYIHNVDTSVYDPDFYQHEGRVFYQRPGEIVTEDANWFETFGLLAKAASLIVSIPIDASPSSEQSSAIEEIVDLHANRILEKCIFLMPPEQSVWLLRPSDETDNRRGTDRSWTSRERKMSSLWESTRTKLARRGITLPEFRDTSDGATIFNLFGNECRMAVVRSRELSNPSAYTKALGINLRTEPAPA
jgi:hypothetical protein